MAISLTTMTTRVRVKVQESTANYWADSDLQQMLQEATREAARRLMAEDESYFAATDDTINVSSGTQEYSLPTDHIITLRVERTDQSSTYPEQLYEVDFAHARESGTGPRYYFKGKNIGIVDARGATPDTSMTLAHAYIGIPADISTNIDQQLEYCVDAITNWAAAEALAQEEGNSNARFFQVKGDRAFRQFLAVVYPRQRQTVDFMVDQDPDEILWY